MKSLGDIKEKVLRKQLNKGVWSENKTDVSRGRHLGIGSYTGRAAQSAEGEGRRAGQALGSPEL